MDNSEKYQKLRNRITLLYYDTIDKEERILKDLETINLTLINI